ncbi:MAG: 2-hydroxyacyl-CoA dehydratase family protein [Rhodospirillaceae bacterium]|nr:2-hydroxyacyl-CoA dehydratase family protein [Rhodospirillaceae bacterium]
MSRIDDIITQFQTVTANPKAAVEQYKKETGKGAVGILYLYGPEEIVHAAGCLPVGMWGGNKTISDARAHLVPFTCSIMQSVMELECQGTYDILDAVLISVPCDTLKSMSQIWKGKAPPITFVHPQNRNLAAANEFLVEEYGFVKRRLEEILGENIPDEAIERSIDIYNENRKAMREFCEITADYPGIIDPVKRHAVIKARFFMEKSKHTALVKQLIAEIRKQPMTPWNGKKIILTGIMAEPLGLLEIFRNNGFAIVADDLAQESRQFRHDVPAGRTPLHRLARWWQELEGCPLAMDPGKARGQMLIDLASRYEADGVVVCMMKFCDPEEFDYPIYYPQLKKAGIKNTTIEIDLEEKSFEQARTRIQTFAEVIH